MSTRNTIYGMIFLGVIAVITVITLLSSLIPSLVKGYDYVYNSPQISTMATSGVITLVAGQQGLLLGTSTARFYAHFSTTCGAPVYLRLYTGAALPNTGGIILTATSGPYEININNRYTSQVYASSSQACTVNVSEGRF